MAVVLRKRHNLKGVSLAPLIRRIRAGGDQVANLARLSKDLDTATMTRQDLNVAVKRLTGRETADDVMAMVQDGPPSLDALRRTLHFVILEANERGQQLEEAPPGELNYGAQKYWKCI